MGGAAALAAVALLAACERQPAPAPVDSPAAGARTGAWAEDGAPAGKWAALPDSPLAAREEAPGFWVNGRLLILGGSAGPPCPPAASCTWRPGFHRDGAAFDPRTGEWTELADAPVPLVSARGVAAGERIYVLVGQDGFLRYDVAADRWDTLPVPGPAAPSWRSLAADGDTVVAYRGSHELDGGDTPPDLRFDPDARTWSALPPSPLGPGFDRFMVGTDHGLVLLQAPLVGNPGAGNRPSLWEAALLGPDGHWRELPPSEIATGWAPWVWSGGRVVAAHTGVTSGGGEPPGDYGREIPFGGMLDPAAGAWEPLPPAGADPWQWQMLSAHGDEMVFRDGLLLHVPERRWIDVPLPPGPDRYGATAVWAGDRLVLWGGSSFAGAAGGALHADGWTWAPPED